MKFTESKSDLAQAFGWNDIQVQVTSENVNKEVQIIGANGFGLNRIPVIIGMNYQIATNYHIYPKNVNWYIQTDIAQTYNIRFYKYPSFA